MTDSLTPQIVEFPGSAILGHHEILVGLEGGEANRHLWDNTGCHRPETLVEGQGRFFLHDLHSYTNKGQVGSLYTSI